MPILFLPAPYSLFYSTQHAINHYRFTTGRIYDRILPDLVNDHFPAGKIPAQHGAGFVFINHYYHLHYQRRAGFCISHLCNTGYYYRDAGYYYYFTIDQK